jgi:hypothetical protein
MKRGVLLAVTLVLWTGRFYPFAWSQTSAIPVLSKRAELQMRIVPDKATYSLKDKLATAIEFINLTEKTLCFPKPSRQTEVPARGFVRITTIGPKGSDEGELLIDHYDGGITWPVEKLAQEIREQWIWLAPNAVYRTSPEQTIAELRVSGQWRLEATYRPPEGSFHPAESKNYLNSAAQIAGCSVPQKVVSAHPISVIVSP